MSVLFKDKITGIWKRAAANLIYASFPVGSIVAYGGSSDVAAPAGCMYCHGQVLNESEYPDLYAVIGTKFGVGDGSAGSFSLPELRGEFLRGTGTNPKTGYAGANVGVHQEGTAVPVVSIQTSGAAVMAGGAGNHYCESVDKPVVVSRQSQISSGDTAGSGYYYGYARPTNTSVEYIIKVVK